MKQKENDVVVLLSHMRWDSPCDYIKQTASELGKKTSVVIFNPLAPLTLKNLIFDPKRRKAYLAVWREKDFIFFPSFGLLPFQRFKLVERANIKINLNLFRVFYHLKFRSKKPIFWAFSYELADLIKYFKWGRFFIYDRVDQASSLDLDSDYLIKEKDRRLLFSSDFVFVNSSYTLRHVQKFNKNSYFVGWGFAPQLFSSPPRVLPAEIKRIKKPRLGLVGHLDHRLDLDLLCRLASNRKDWNFIVIGPVFDFDPKQARIVDFHHKLKIAKKFPNIYFLGKKPKEKISSYIAALDVCLILYDTSQEFVRGCNPMKLYEYLAMGKPVVSTNIEAVKEFFPLVKTSDKANVFQKHIEDFLADKYNLKARKQRKKIAEKQSWQKRIKKILKIIREEKNEKKRND